MDHGSHGLPLMLKLQLVFQAATRTLTSHGFGGWLLGSRILWIQRALNFRQSSFCQMTSP